MNRNQTNRRIQTSKNKIQKKKKTWIPSEKKRTRARRKRSTRVEANDRWTRRGRGQNKAGRTRKVATRCDRIRFRRGRKRLRGKGTKRRNGVRGKREIGGWWSVHAPVANVMIGPRKQKRQTLGLWPPGVQIRGPDKARCSINLSRARRKIRLPKLPSLSLSLSLFLLWRKMNRQNDRYYCHGVTPTIKFVTNKVRN